MKTPRAERLVDMTRYLMERPRTLVPLTFFANRFSSAKSSISEDLTILKKTLKERGVGLLETIPGAAGGAKFYPYILEREADEFVNDMLKQVNDETRVLPGGYVYLSDLLGQPAILRQVGRIIATEYLDMDIQAVMTAATKGVPMAAAVAAQLNVPFVIVRSGENKVTEGPTVSVNYLTGSSKHVEKMELSRRSLPTGLNILIVDDFMKAGGTINGMKTLAKEFDSHVKGVAVFAEGRARQRQVDDFTSLLHVDTNLDSGEVIKVQIGNYKENIFRGRENRSVRN
ncbi:pur operon repressor [Oenococcus kitaharae]|uniref:PurR: transcription regulator associated with purine metabolism n=1 Tax=Oenococcus kitaharae DSM 17330 TaxID=1045004 RepID=G9WEQ3_9LACO|nr:pur operon repressor [Oenococcus kitaharae]EHN58226.1 PurR: transcription regulator associated with purine metabolism [Oenococcus kitaharae DSM 17330]MCV3296533.1 pur operon repressor [Oenococcus kitaharae]OEY81587.1 purine operon repressor [Oenococcus kitaharae]OEY83073.1 purine operon repressor [Oenococcus kitaharae]OEY84381.1 purine operon repressor [Oenococcus kitaharae]